MQDNEPEFLKAYLGFHNDGLNPLATMSFYLELLLNDYLGPLSPKQERALSAIYECCKEAMNVWHRMSDHFQITYHQIHLENISAHKFLAQIQELEHLVEVEVKSTIPAKDITCNVGYIILALKYLVSPSISTRKSTQEQRNRIIITFKAETVHIVLKTQATVGDVSDILRLQAYPGTIYHIVTHIIQQHRGEVGITEEDGFFRFSFDLPLVSTNT